MPMTAVDPAEAAVISPAIVRSLERALSDESLGDVVHGSVTTADGDVLWAEQAESPVAPASSLKLLTALSILDVAPADSRLTTSVVAGDGSDSVVLVGGGDATLALKSPRAALGVASLTDLAKRTARALLADGTSSVHLSFDDSAFAGPAISPHWEPTYVTSGVIAPVTALMVDQGLVSKGSLARYPDPAKAAADDFASLLEAQGVNILGSVGQSKAAAADPIAQVQSPTIEWLVQRMLRDSDNQLAEALARVAASESDLPPTFSGGVNAMAEAADRHGISVDAQSVFDASGLSRDDRITVDDLVAVLQTAGADAQFRSIVEGLPVSGFDGTLFDRYLVPPQNSVAGVVRAKTGTLTGISTESGTTLTCDGALVLFSFATDQVTDTEAARDALDQAVASLSSC